MPSLKLLQLQACLELVRVFDKAATASFLVASPAAQHTQFICIAMQCAAIAVAGVITIFCTSATYATLSSLDA